MGLGQVQVALTLLGISNFFNYSLTIFNYLYFNNQISLIIICLLVNSIMIAFLPQLSVKKVIFPKLVIKLVPFNFQYFSHF